MKLALLSLPFVLVVGLIIYVGKPNDGFSTLITLWNCLPVLLGFFLLVDGLRSRRSLLGAFATFAVIGTLLPALFHLAWIFDWGGTATGSSTSALAFLVVPFWSIGLALIVAIVVGFFCHVLKKDDHVA